MRKRNIYRNSISRIIKSAVVLPAVVSALLLPSGCERENLLKELAGEEAVMRFSVSESVPELLTKSQAAQAADRRETTEENVIVLTSADGRTLRLIAEEEPLTARTSSASAEASASAQGPATKAAAVYGSSDATPLGGASIGVWAYNFASPNSAFSDWRLDSGTPSGPVEATQSGTLWKPTPDIQYHSDGHLSYTSTRWFALAPYGAMSGTSPAVSGMTASDKYMSATYTVPTAVDKQWDLLSAVTEHRPIDETGAVALSFEHVLTGVRFKRDANLNVSRIVVSGVYDQAKLDMSKRVVTTATTAFVRPVSWFTSVDGTSAPDASKDLWSSRTKLGSSYELTLAAGDWTNGNPKDNTKEKQYDYAKEDANILMMIPQLTPQGAKITVTINGEPYTGDISGHRWLPGRLVTYRINKQPTDFLFSVSATKKVYFSQGNLQYEWGPGDAAIAATVAAGNQPTTDVTGKWYFAANEWETIGFANKANTEAMNAGTAVSGETRIDLFPWGTSGKNYGAKKYYPWAISAASGNDPEFGPATPALLSLSNNSDWGINTIQNGTIKNGTQEVKSGWRTLSHHSGKNLASEWVYLSGGRANANKLIGLGQIVGDDGVTILSNGLILLPDDWLDKDLDPKKNLSAVSSGGSFVSPHVKGVSDSHALASTDNIYKASDWSKMAENGAVFLPASGARQYFNGEIAVRDQVSTAMSSATYATATTVFTVGLYQSTYRLRYNNADVNTCPFYFRSNWLQLLNDQNSTSSATLYFQDALAVRLVRDVE